jgi:hypothetical protein
MFVAGNPIAALMIDGADSAIKIFTDRIDKEESYWVADQ